MSEEKPSIILNKILYGVKNETPINVSAEFFDALYKELKNVCRFGVNGPAADTPQWPYEIRMHTGADYTTLRGPGNPHLVPKTVPKAWWDRLRASLETKIEGSIHSYQEERRWALGEALEELDRIERGE